jgi:peptide-methionine (S)-S-oxide reductase
MENNREEMAVLGAGCFWCVEAVFQQLNGVLSVESGFCGGFIKNPSYREVCNGTTGHAEVAKIIFNPEVVSFHEILEVFWSVHDPTTLNRQGNDIGTQYRSAIYYTSEQQKEIAEQYLNQLEQSRVFANPIVTEITKFDVFYPAEEYHTNYFNLHGEEQYCQFVVRPKVEKFKAKFASKLKKD